MPLMLVAISIILFAVDLTTGTAGISFSDALKLLFSPDRTTPAWMTMHMFRIPRVITAVVAGIALSVSGLQMQTIFRNPLAGPYVLGISSGAGLGVALVVLGFSSFFSYNIFSPGNSWLLILAAWAGAGIVMFVILILSIRIKDVMTILILGIMTGSGISAVISILQYFSQESALKAFVIWTMGSLTNVGNEQIPFLLAGFIPGLVLAVVVLKPSNAVMLGENYARTMGVNIKVYRVLVFASTSLLTGTVTAFCGPLGFVGIAVPHLARMISRTSKSNILFIYSILIGTSVMLLSDIITMLPGAGLILPVNAVTSLLGIPVVLWIVFRRKRIFT
ncbi:MAG TPA: iron ABC transporter permease [Bacteroidales bacterium]|nr:iron ABC transporter permease [Bacteroidales bacterium]